MAFVSLATAYLHEAVNPASFLRLYTDGPGHESPQAGSIRMMANGRRRIITSAQRQTTLTVTFPQVTSAELEQLEEWRGALLMYRDVFQRFLFGTYFSTSPTPWKDRSGFSVTVTFEEATHSIEAVPATADDFVSLS